MAMCHWLHITHPTCFLCEKSKDWLLLMSNKCVGRQRIAFSDQIVTWWSAEKDHPWRSHIVITSRFICSLGQHVRLCNIIQCYNWQGYAMHYNCDSFILSSAYVRNTWKAKVAWKSYHPLGYTLNRSTTSPLPCCLHKTQRRGRDNQAYNKQCRNIFALMKRQINASKILLHDCRMTRTTMGDISMVCHMHWRLCVTCTITVHRKLLLAHAWHKGGTCKILWWW